MIRSALIAGTHSGCGKTTVTLAIMSYLREKGFRVQPFKAGPDYIDPSWHKVVTGLPSVNLDLFSMGEDVKFWFWKYAHKADFSPVEGVMGLFDGEFSSFELAKLLKLPVILVVDVYGMAETVEVLVEGFKNRLQKYSIDLYLILNRVSSERHLIRLEKKLKKFKVLGAIFKKREAEISSRHLGLFLPEHVSLKNEVIEVLKEEVKRNIDIDTLLSLGTDLKISNFSEAKAFNLNFPFKKLGIAFDEAFCFYYTHFLDILKSKCELKFFSPLRDKGFPEDVEALYIGGGYPELFAEKLSENRTFIKALKEFVDEGGVLYAECGGFIYLCRFLNYRGKRYPLIGIFPFEVEMKGLYLDYCRVRLLENAVFLKRGDSFKGHEFHYTRIRECGEVKKVYEVKGLNKGSRLEGYTFKNALATYIHFLYPCNNLFLKKKDL